MAARTKNPTPSRSGKSSKPESMSFEEAVEALESIIDRIERGEIGLEEALSERKRGDALVKRCRAILEAAEQELETIAVDGEGDEGAAD